MKKRAFITILVAFTLMAEVVGCSGKKTEQDKKSVKDNTANIVESNNSTAPEHTEPDQSEAPEGTTTDNKDIAAPDKATVLSQRAIALSGMSSEDIESLTAAVSKINLRLEAQYLYGDLERHYSDPNSHSWNILEQTGEVLIGYSFSEEAMKKKKELNLTEEEFEIQYGEPVLYDNEYDADRICEELNTLKSSIQDKNLIQDFDNAIEYIQNAKKTHDIQYFLDFYKLYHDMDYYLLRYGPEDVGAQVEDTSTIDLFYGMLSCYK